MFIATITPDAAPSSVGAAWMVVMALRQGFGESGGASAHKHVAPTGLGGLGDALGYKHAAHTGLVRVLERAIKEARADLRPSYWE